MYGRIEEYDKVQINREVVVQRDISLIQVHWETPKTSWVKLNFDGANNVRN